MTPQEKARELVDKFYTELNEPCSTIRFNQAKECAIICSYHHPESETDFDKIFYEQFWEEVIKEINKLEPMEKKPNL